MQIQTTVIHSQLFRYAQPISVWNSCRSESVVSKA